MAMISIVAYYYKCQAYTVAKTLQGHFSLSRQSVVYQTIRRWAGALAFFKCMLSYMLKWV